MLICISEKKMDISEYVENNSNNLQVENEERPVHLAVLRIHLILMQIRIFFRLFLS